MNGVRRWPLFLIAAPAAVAVWSGWVGLGSMCGFGVVAPLPGILPGFHVDTAITLPVGVEAYGAYALGAWLTPGPPAPVRTFARRSAIGALALGMAGQVIYHLLTAAHATRAPWPVVVLVSCLPVVTLGFGAALTHLLRADPGDDLQTATAADVTPEDAGAAGHGAPALPAVPAPDPAVTPEVISGSPAPKVAPEVTLGAALHAVPEVTRGRPRNRPSGAPGKQSGPATPERLREHYAAELAAGQVPSIRQIKREWPVGYDRATELHDHLTAVTETAS